MHETVEYSVNSWKSIIASTAPWAIVVGIFQYVLRGMDTTQTTVEANNEAFVAVAQELALFELIVPMLFLLVAISLFGPLLTRV